MQDCPSYKLLPRGSTALLDAVGRAINETGARLSKIAEAYRPGLVIFVVMTDGEENSLPSDSYKKHHGPAEWRGRGVAVKSDYSCFNRQRFPRSGASYSRM